MRKTAEIFWVLALFLLTISLQEALAQHQYIVYSSATQSGISSNLVRYDTSTGETFLLTGFAETDAGIIQSVSSDSSGRFVYFTRSSSLNNRENPAIWRIGIDGSGLTDFLSPETNISYTHVAVSPNGKTIAYVANNTENPLSYHLYTCNSDGTYINKITSDANVVCSYPVFLTDTKILFKIKKDFLEKYCISDISDLSGIITDITTTETSPYFPRLGRPMAGPSEESIRTPYRYTTYYIIYAKQIQQPEGYDQWKIYQSLITYKQKLEPPEEKETLTVSESELTHDYDNTSLLNTSLFFVETDPDKQEEPYPAYAGGADKIVFCGSMASNVYDLFSVNIPIITTPYLLQITQGSSHITLPCYINVAAQPQNFVYLDRSGFVHLIDISNKNDIQITSSSGNLHPTINTRGSIIAYANNGIYTVRTDGTTTPIQIDSDSASDYPEFSPDGFFVLYKKNNDIYARRADCSSEPTRLTYTSSVYGDIRFSPQAQEIVFTGISNSQKHIFRCPVHISLTGSISITAGSPVDLTPLTFDNYQPAWSCDGSTIVFISTRNKIAELWLMNRDGTGQRKILFSSSAPDNPSNPCFATDSSSTIFYLSDSSTGSSKQFYTADISQPSISGTPVFSVFPAPSAESFFIGRRSENVIECERFVNIKERDPAVPFTYFLTMHVDKIPDSSKSAIITEIIPSGWELKDITINGVPPGQLTSNSATTGTLKWLFGPSGIADLQDSILQITLDIPDTEPYGSIKGFSGWCETNRIKTYTTGCSNIFIAEPFIPVDTDKNWQISDEELLYTISLWSQNGKISGWPDDVLTWDLWLLSVIGFWANIDGYAYDSDASKGSGIYIWKKI